MSKKKTTEEFIKQSRIIHKNKYDYSLVNYDGAFSKVKIICPVHGEFEQLARSHIFGHGCYKCEIGTNDFNSFVEKANTIHKNKYDYSLVVYKNSFSKVKIICPIHGEFSQTPNLHLQKCGCIQCRKDRLALYAKKRIVPFEIFKVRADTLFNKKFTYFEDSYTKMSSKTKIECPIHGLFFIEPSEHLRGRGCSKCNFYYGESLIRNILTENNILFEEQKKFDDCKYKNKLSFDFYLPKEKTLIEYQGIQHYIPVEYFGGKKAFEEQKIRDKIKSDYCINNHFSLFEIKYDSDIEGETKRCLEVYKNNGTF